MERAARLSDCPECGGTRTVILDVCYICLSEFGENEGVAGCIFDVDEVA
jgi:hypothetical protein